MYYKDFYKNSDLEVIIERCPDVSGNQFGLMLKVMTFHLFLDTTIVINQQNYPRPLQIIWILAEQS